MKSALKKGLWAILPLLLSAYLPNAAAMDDCSCVQTDIQEKKLDTDSTTDIEVKTDEKKNSAEEVH